MLPIQRERPPLILTPFDSTLALGCWSVPSPIRKQQIWVNAFVNPMGCYTCLTKQSGSELCALISCLEGRVEKKGHFPTTCGSALPVLNQVHPWPVGQRVHPDNHKGVSLLFNYLCPLRNSGERTHQVCCFYEFPPLSLWTSEALNGLQIFCFLPSAE